MFIATWLESLGLSGAGDSRIEGPLDGTARDPDAEYSEFLLGWREFGVAEQLVFSAAHVKHQFRAGDDVEGVGVPSERAEIETADVSKASALRVLSRGGRMVR